MQTAQCLTEKSHPGKEAGWRSSIQMRQEEMTGFLRQELHMASKRTVSLSAGQEHTFKDSEMEALQTQAESWKHVGGVSGPSLRPFQDCMFFSSVPGSSCAIGGTF